MILGCEMHMTAAHIIFPDIVQRMRRTKSSITCRETTIRTIRGELYDVVHEYGKVLIDGSDLDIASVIAVAK